MKGSSLNILIFHVSTTEFGSDPLTVSLHIFKDQAEVQTGLKRLLFCAYHCFLKEAFITTEEEIQAHIAFLAWSSHFVDFFFIIIF